MADILQRDDLDTYLEEQLDSERSFHEVVSTQPEAAEAGSVDVVRLSLRDDSGAPYRSICGTVAIAAGLAHWAMDASMNGDFSPVTSFMTVVLLYRYLRRR